MKKLQLSKQIIDNASMLSREELKTVFGGDDELGSGGTGPKGNSCNIYCPSSNVSITNCNGVCSYGLFKSSITCQGPNNTLTKSC
ncbi:hypothetical protein MC916_002614 [Elizabethkingia anophelis]|uniref:Natural product, GG-Bacteroidales family n=1 Tax=Elizabethkingia miricola TaxID=172045 RepID=A0ABD5B345_ELIMR|nr:MULTISPECIES: hypothetical protein [Elizabethkingia]EHM7982726.1 hypothetical protein [Elizabethkingia anophelis]EHM8032439.1 hypothetical protein [Elizabethkingia anophelis]EHZ9535409.1 hypothetical protein [Elizabethkingia anophelis]EKU3673319.1 hypothetical protein [Elizabethkingia anophelis]EKU4210298.1 hypothetical protein [Elizabethkingia anophelis]